MSKEKKKYEKPVLCGIDMLKAGAGPGTKCCRTTNATCSKASRDGQSKQTRSRTGS